MQRRWTIILVLAGAVIIAVSAVAYLMQQRADSPAGSLEALSEAARSGDWATVETYMDVDAVGTGIAESSIAEATGGAPATSAQPESASGMGGGESQSGVMARMSSVYAANFRTLLQARVEEGIDEDATGVIGLLVVGKAEHVEYVSETEARVTVEVPMEDEGTAEIIATMVRAGDHWQIIALENLSDDQLPTE